MFRKVLALAMPLAVAVIAHCEASAQTGPRRDDRSGKEVVEAVCAECHAMGVKGAPRIGERADWSARLSHGLSNAVNAAIRGHGGMPARGGKADLTDSQKRVLELLASQDLLSKRLIASAKDLCPLTAQTVLLSGDS